MSEYRAVMERDLHRIGRAGFSFDDLDRRRQRKRRNQRIQSAVVGLLVAILALGSLLYAFQERSAPVPAAPSITPGNVADLRLLDTVNIGRSTDGLNAADGLVYVRPRGGDHDLLAFPASCGSQGQACTPTWTADVPGELSPASSAGNGVEILLGDQLRAYSATCAEGGAACAPISTEKPAGTGSKGGVIVAGDTVIVSNFDAVSAFSTACVSHGGHCPPLWESPPVQQHFGGSIAVARGAVFVASISPTHNGPGPIYSFPLHCRRDGGECAPTNSWSVPEPSGAAFTATGGSVFLGTAIDALHGMIRAYPASCFGHPNCAPTWRDSAPGALNAAPVVAGGRVIVFSRFGANFVSAYPKDCADPCVPLWTAEGVPDISWARPAVSNSVLYVASQSQGIRAYPIDCGTSNARCSPAWAWGYAHDGSAPVGIRFVVATSDRVFAGSTGGKLYAFGVGARLPEPATGSDGATLAIYAALALIGLIAVLVQRNRRRGGRDRTSS